MKTYSKLHERNGSLRVDIINTITDGIKKLDLYQKLHQIRFIKPLVLTVKMTDNGKYIPCLLLKVSLDEFNQLRFFSGYEDEINGKWNYIEYLKNEELLHIIRMLEIKEFTKEEFTKQ